jgi:anti-anti-sigma factor
VETVELDGEVVVRVSGKAGFEEAGALEGGLVRVAARRPLLVTFDLSKLRFVSSLAMGLLVAYRRAFVRAGVRVRLAPDLQPAVREALQRAGLTDLFEVLAHAEAARNDSRGLAKVHSS